MSCGYLVLCMLLLLVTTKRRRQCGLLFKVVLTSGLQILYITRRKDGLRMFGHHMNFQLSERRT